MVPVDRRRGLGEDGATAASWRGTGGALGDGRARRLPGKERTETPGRRRWCQLTGRRGRRNSRHEPSCQLTGRAGQPIHAHIHAVASQPLGGEALVPVDGGAPGVVGAESSCQLAPGVDLGRGAESVVRHAGGGAHGGVLCFGRRAPGPGGPPRKIERSVGPSGARALTLVVGEVEVNPGWVLVGIYICIAAGVPSGRACPAPLRLGPGGQPDASQPGDAHGSGGSAARDDVAPPQRHSSLAPPRGACSPGPAGEAWCQLTGCPPAGAPSALRGEPT